MKFRIPCTAALLIATLTASPLWAAQDHRDFHPLMLDTRDTELFSAEGYVFDEFNGIGVGDAEVRLDGVGGSIETETTDSSGFFRFTGLDPADFPYNQSTLTVEHAGYLDSEPMELLEGVCPTVHLRSKTVVLIHGLGGSYDGTWGGSSGAFPTALDSVGFHVVGIDIGGFPTSILPVSTALAVFRSILEDTCHQAGIQSYDVIGHSMGGLVSRSYATKSYGNNRINKLVTLGTPHHGSVLANDALTLAWLLDLALKKMSGGLCCFGAVEYLANQTALRDLAVGSQFLNSLNYNQDSDSSFFNPCRTSFSETTNHGDTSLFSIAGTQFSEWYNPVRPFVGCWWLSSDGIVLKPRALFHEGHVCTEIGLGCEGVHHKEERSQGIAKSACIAGKVVDLLKDGTFDCTTRFDREEEGIVPSRLPLIEGIVQPGTTHEDTTLINAMNLVDFLCFSTADSLVYNLESPSGRIIDPDECESDPDLEYIRNLGTAYYSIQNPESGLWKHFVTLVDGTEPEDIMIVTTFDGEVVLVVEGSTGVDPDDAFTLYASFTDAGYSIPTGVVTATVTRPDSSTDQIELFDDGFADDEIAGDGIYTATYPAGGESGTFSFVFLGETDPGSPQSEAREALHLATAAWLPDPAIGEAGLVIDETEVPFGGLVGLSASFTNQGTATADSLLITLSNVTYGVALAETLLVGMAPGQTITLQAEWLAVAEGEFTLRAGIDIIGEQIESNLSNNGDEVVVVVSIPDDVTSVPDDGADGGHGGDPETGTSRILLYPSFPNPLASGSTSIRFQVPQAGGQTELAVFDIRGRRVRTLVSEVLPQGEHARSWDGGDHSGRQVASGVYFYRLQVAGEVKIKKMVVVR